MRHLLQKLKMAFGLAAKEPVKAPGIKPPNAVDDKFRQMTFTFSVIALAAKLSSLNGKSAAQSFPSFQRVFPLPDESEGKVRALFEMACKEAVDAQHYARKIAHFFPGQTGLLADLLMRLNRFAAIDGAVTPAARRLLDNVASALEMPREAVHPALPPYKPSAETDHYALLGINRRASAEAIKKAYRVRMRELHPDRLPQQGLKEKEAAHDALIAVNEAYRVITRKRGTR